VRFSSQPPLLARSSGLEGGQVAVLRLRATFISHATVAAYSPRGTGATLKCSIFHSNAVFFTKWWIAAS
jgi:hypothetical protein